MREIAFGRVFPNKVSWTMGRFKARAGHFQIKSLGKHQLWTQSKSPGVIKNRSPSEMAVPGIVYIYHNPMLPVAYIYNLLESGTVFLCLVVVAPCFCLSARSPLGGRRFAPTTDGASRRQRAALRAAPPQPQAADAHQIRLRSVRFWVSCATCMRVGWSRARD